MENIIEYIKNKKKLFIFIAGFLSYYLFLSYSGFAGGKYSIIYGDSIEIFVPAIKSFLRDIINGESIYYSWNNSMGMNSSFYNAAFANVFSITTPVYFLLYKTDFMFATCIALSIKAGLAALFFYMYITYAFKCKGFFSSIFSICYSMCSFNTYYCLTNTIWSDGVFLLPLILYLIHRLIKENKFIFLPIAYFYLFITQFYMGYVIGFFSLIYFILVLIIVERKQNKELLHKIIVWGLCVLISIGLSAFLLLPAALYYLKNPVLDSTTIESLNVNIIDIFNQFLPLEYNGMRGLYPYLYCGTITIIFATSFFINKSIDRLKKIFWGILLTLMMISCVVLPLYLFWHAFDAPDGWGFRFSFLISFILCAISAIELSSIDSINIKNTFIISVVWLLIYVVEYFVQLKFHSDVVTNSLLGGIVVFFILLLNNNLLYLYQKFKNNIKYNNVFVLLLVLFVGTELIFNACYCVNGFDGVSYVYSDAVSLLNDSNNEMLNELSSKDSDFYRINVMNDFLYNGDSMFGYNGVSDFGTSENYVLRNSLSKLGLYSSPRITLSTGLTDFTKMILSVRYDVISVMYQAYTIIENQHALIYDNDKILNLGFLVNKDVCDVKLEGYDSFKNINELASAMIGKKSEIYSKCPPSKLYYIEDGISVKEIDGQILYEVNDEMDSHNLYVMYPDDGKQKYIQFSYDTPSLYKVNSPIIDGTENMYDEYSRLSSSYIKPMDHIADDYSITIIMNDWTVDSVNAPIYYVYDFNVDELEKVYNELSVTQLNVVDFKDGYVKGNIKVDDNDKVLFTSIPYDDDWSVYVDGQKVDKLKLVNDAFLGVKLDKGEHEIEFVFNAKGSKEGIIISLISLCIYVIVVLITTISNRRRENRIEH